MMPIPASSSSATVTMIAAGALLHRVWKRSSRRISAAPCDQPRADRKAAAGRLGIVDEEPHAPGDDGEMDHAALRPRAGVGDGEDRLAAQREQQARRLLRGRALNESELAAGGTVGRG